jgi:thiosulfate dehydrogenase (quinone) large subunit
VPENIARCREAISMSTTNLSPATPSTVKPSTTRLSTASSDIAAVIGEPNHRTNLSVWESLKSSKIAAIAWTAMRVWLGVMWIQAGSAKLWGAEAAGFLHNGGAGVAGFAAHGTPAYSWWGSFLHGFVVPNAGWIGVLIALAEFAIGIALVAGLFTRIAALGSLALLFTYVMSGTASVCAFYAAIAIVILVMWRTSSWIGVDGLISGYRQRHPNLFQNYLPFSHKQGVTGTAITVPAEQSTAGVR